MNNKKVDLDDKIKKDEEKNEEEYEKENENLAIFLPLGMMMGAAIDLLFGKIAMATPIGMMIGLTIGLVLDNKEEDKDK